MGLHKTKVTRNNPLIISKLEKSSLEILKDFFKGFSSDLKQA